MVKSPEMLRQRHPVSYSVIDRLKFWWGLSLSTSNFSDESGVRAFKSAEIIDWTPVAKKLKNLNFRCIYLFFSSFAMRCFMRYWSSDGVSEADECLSFNHVAGSGEWLSSKLKHMTWLINSIPVRFLTIETRKLYDGSRHVSRCWDAEMYLPRRWAESFVSELIPQSHDP